MNLKEEISKLCQRIVSSQNLSFFGREQREMVEKWFERERNPIIKEILENWNEEKQLIQHFEKKISNLDHLFGRKREIHEKLQNLRQEGEWIERCSIEKKKRNEKCFCKMIQELNWKKENKGEERKWMDFDCFF